MTRSLFTYVPPVAALAAALVAIAPALATPAQDFARIQQHLRQTATMTADFVQTDRNGRAVSGTLTMKRPGKVRFQYQKGVPLLIVGDGKALTMIDYQVRQVSRWPVGDSPLAVLLDPSKDVSRFARIVDTGSPATLVVEGRDPKHPEFGTISIAFQRVASAPGGLTLKGWTTLDAQGNRTSVSLANQRFNVAVADNAFRWTDPRRSGPRG